jgi:hypothetical protein
MTQITRLIEVDKSFTMLGSAIMSMLPVITDSSVPRLVAESAIHL